MDDTLGSSALTFSSLRALFENLAGNVPLLPLTNVANYTLPPLSASTVAYSRWAEISYLGTPMDTVGLQ